MKWTLILVAVIGSTRAQLGLTGLFGGGQTEEPEKKELNSADYVYVTSKGLGVSSYHLSSDGGDSYINYTATENMRSDNGEKLPNIKYFVDPKFNMEKRTFTGKILWTETPVMGGKVEWDFVMKFSQDWSTIESGGVRNLFQDGRKSYSTLYPKPLSYSRYSNQPVDEDKEDELPAKKSMETDFVYVTSHGLGVQSYHLSSNGGDSYISYEDAPDGWTTDQGQKYPARQYFVDPKFNYETRTFTGRILWNRGSVYGGMLEWDLVMKFSQDWSTIISGGSRNLYQDGRTDYLELYPDNLYYTRVLVSSDKDKCMTDCSNVRDPQDKAACEYFARAKAEICSCDAVAKNQSQKCLRRFQRSMNRRSIKVAKRCFSRLLSQTYECTRKVIKRTGVDMTVDSKWNDFSRRQRQNWRNQVRMPKRGRSQWGNQ